MALGEPISAQPIAEAGLRRLASELVGPRPAAIAAGKTRVEPAERRTALATRP
jgi:hypothetical protein